VFRVNRHWNRGVHVVLAAGVVWLVVGHHGALPAAVPWSMAGWLSLDGIVTRSYWPWFVAIGLCACALAYMFSHTPVRALVLLAAVCAAATIALTAGSERWCVPERCEFLALSPIFIRRDVVFGWRWVNRHTKHATIANAGNNVPYPLFGADLKNRVYYINIDRHREWRFHDYDKAHRQRRPEDPAPVHALATPSGLLLPLDPAAVRSSDAVRPRLARLNGSAAAWLQNLKARGVDRLFVTRLSAYELAYNWHDDGGFPIEAEWARSAPGSFALIFENSEVQVYRVRIP
jgi:hypothetical protein